MELGSMTALITGAAGGIGHALSLGLLPEGGPSGRVFWDEKEYVLFDPENPTCNLFRRNPETRETEVFEN